MAAIEQNFMVGGFAHFWLCFCSSLCLFVGDEEAITSLYQM